MTIEEIENKLASNAWGIRSENWNFRIAEGHVKRRKDTEIWLPAKTAIPDYR